ncbi:hypothetical protein ES288_D06G204500v1 [Gossypium darwinii]|uniref:Uncharacterized protein n=1 Tax=Gossypium darwinii TaxID=34276 RepID=A0A5D2C7T2_GOSDA|nr:hypothetical protein ES288_D06G204500v1 [Gossypium darwinii]
MKVQLRNSLLIFLMSLIYVEISNLSTSLSFTFLITVNESPSTTSLHKPKSRHNLIATVQAIVSAEKAMESSNDR